MRSGLLRDIPTIRRHGMHDYHLMVCDALGLDHIWYEVADSA
jgi:hypothetical protein